jgi:hypothetical protein
MYREAAACTAKCYAAGRAAANANMRKHNRSDWNREDYDIATVVTEVCLLGDPDRGRARPAVITNCDAGSVKEAQKHGLVCGIHLLRSRFCFFALAFRVAEDVLAAICGILRETPPTADIRARTPP